MSSRGEAAVVGRGLVGAARRRLAGLRPHHDGDEPRVEVRRVDAGDLAAELAPVLAEVTR